MALFGVLTALTGACSSSETVAEIGEPCFVNSDCASPLVCVFQTCHLQCRADEDCREALDDESLCQRGSQPVNVCQNENERECDTDSVCAPGQLCAVDERCRDHCQSARGCTAGQVCVQAACANEDELENGRLVSSSGEPPTGVACSYNSDCPAGNVCSAGVCRVECREHVDCALDECCTEEQRCALLSGRGPDCTPLMDGGGGEGGAPSNGEAGAGGMGAPTVSPLGVIAAVPEADATDVEPTTSLSVTFSEPLDPETITSATFTLTAAGVQVPAKASANAAVATLVPSAPLARETRYTAVVSTDVTSVSGGSLKVPYSFSFETGAANWSGSTVLDPDLTGDAAWPRIGFDANGAVAAWTQCDGSVCRLYTSQLVSGSWAAAEQLSNDAAGDVNPQIALGLAADGGGLLVWRQALGDLANIHASSRSGGVWSEPELIDANIGAPSTTGNTRAVLSIDANGNGVAAWKQYDGKFHVRANRFAAGSWGASTTVSDDTTGDGDADLRIAIASSAHGNAVVAWQFLSDNGYDVWANDFSVGAWGTPQPLESDEVNGAMHPDVAIGTNGDAWAVWRQLGADPRITARRFAGGSWGTALPIHPALPGIPAEPFLAIDAEGNGIAVWPHFDGVDNSTIVANRLLAGNWGAPVTISQDGGPAEEARIAMRPDGSAVAVWLQDKSIWAARFENEHWQPAELVETGAGDADSPFVAVGPDGSATVTFRQQGSDGVWTACAASFR